MSAPIVRPGARSFGDDFYRAVTDRYLHLGRTTSKIGLAIATESGVPVTTAHRWIAEARRRGLLTVRWTEAITDRRCPTCGTLRGAP